MTTCFPRTICILSYFIFVLFLPSSGQELPKDPAAKKLLQQILSKKYRIAIAELAKLSPEKQEKIVPYIIQALDTGNGNQRFRAIKAIAVLGPQAKTAIPKLIAALKDENSRVSRVAAKTLSELKIDSKGVITPLLEDLKSSDALSKRLAIKALIRLRSGHAISALLITLKDKDDEVRALSAEALGFINATPEEAALIAKEMILALEDPSYTVRRVISKALSKLSLASHEKIVLTALKKSIKHQKHQVRMHSARALGRIGNLETIPDMIEMLTDPHAKVKYWASRALLRAAEEKKEVLPMLLIALLKNRNLEARMYLARVIGEIEIIPQAVVSEEVHPTLIEALKRNKKPEVRLSIVWALGKRKVQSQEVIPLLIQILKEGNKEMKKIALWTIGEMGPVAVSVVPEIEKIIEKADWDITYRGKETIKRLTQKEDTGN